jgi:peptidoglycan-associated lipoprotein
MVFRIFALMFAVVLVSACETAPDESAAASGAGTSPAATSSAGSTTAATPSTTAATPSATAPSAGSQEDLVANVGDRVFFDFDKYNLKPDARATLEKQAAWMKQFASVTVSIEGHCDERGTREYNLALGERRANSVKDFLIALGISPSRVKTISYGKERPVALGSDEQAWTQNRRGVTVVTGGSPSG